MQPLFGILFVKTQYILDTRSTVIHKAYFKPLFSKIMGINPNFIRKIKKSIIFGALLHTICCVIAQYSVTVTP